MKNEKVSYALYATNSIQKICEKYAQNFSNDLYRMTKEMKLDYPGQENLYNTALAQFSFQLLHLITKNRFELKENINDFDELFEMFLSLHVQGIDWFCGKEEKC